MRKRLKICYRILKLVLLVFTDLNLELLYCFVHFWSSFGETLVHCREFVVMKISKICTIVKRLININFRLEGVYQLLYPFPRGLQRLSPHWYYQTALNICFEACKDLGNSTIWGEGLRSKLTPNIPKSHPKICEFLVEHNVNLNNASFKLVTISPNEACFTKLFC